MDVLDAMQKYSLTLKSFPTHTVNLSTYRQGRPLGAGETIVEKTFKNGVAKMVRTEKFYDPKWGCKIGDWPHWTKNDFYGRTAEEAVSKAVEYIESKKK